MSNRLKQTNENGRPAACKRTSIGGQALLEGIMMRGPKVTAMAVRNPEGEIVVEKDDNQTKAIPKFFKLPVVRGVYNMVSSFLLGYKYLMRSAEIAGLEDEEPKKAKTDTLSKDPSTDTDTPKKTEAKKDDSKLVNVIMVIGVVLGVLLSVALFIYLPKILFNLIFKTGLGLTEPDASASYGKRYLYQMLVSAFTGVLKIAIFVAYMAAVSFMKDIKRTFMYHGAEHKTIFCYEQGLPLTVENIRRQSRFHPRCGTSFMIIMLIISIVIGFFVPLCADWLYVAIKLLLVPIAVGIGYEFIKFAGRHDGPIVRFLSAPGLWMQRISTKEPTDDMIECAIAAMNEVIPKDNSDQW